mmetsp:Transcript_12311/g.35701  ORF Transcript_12311/g.35701 Transcript_12311/m.35701 type:complete len:489 (-) Transcript_12311:427-1893(-)
MHRAGHDLLTLFRGQSVEANGVSADPDGQVGVLLRVAVCVLEHLSVQDVDVEVVAALRKVAVQHGDQIRGSLARVSKRIGQQTERVGNSVHALGVRDLGHGRQRCQCAVLVTAVHGIATGGKWLSLEASVRAGTRRFAVHHVRRDGEDGQRRLGVTVERLFVELFVKSRNDTDGQGVHAIIVVSELRDFSGGMTALEADGQSILIADRVHVVVLDGGERVGDNGKAGGAKCHQAIDVGIVQGHLDVFVACAIMRIVDGVHRLGVELGHPRDGNVKVHLLEGVVVDGLVLVSLANAQTLAFGSKLRTDVIAVEFIPSAVEAHEEQLDHVRACPEELHVHTDSHPGHAASDGVVAAEDGTHEIVVLVLNGRCRDGLLGAVVLEGCWEVVRPKHREVGFRGRSEVGEGMEEAERGLRHHAVSILEAAAQGKGEPCGISGKQLVVSRRAQVAHDAHLDHEIVDDFLHLLFRERSVGQIAFGVHVEEGIPATD